ncbi:MAG TPA: hypothetical protein V6D04_07145, partial [Candidatus Obscuribacterales bacterium]
MAFSSIIRALGRSPLTAELLTKLNQQQLLRLNGVSRLPKGLVASALAQAASRNLLVITATLEEAGRWTAQLEAMGWQTVHFYPTSEGSPYEPFDLESEMAWGQLQVLADLVGSETATSNSDSNGNGQSSEPRRTAIVATERALQPHLPPVETFRPYCLTLQRGTEVDLNDFSNELARLGYERVSLVETEGQWSRRGDIADVFPVAAELPVRLEWFGDELDKMREFDPATQRSLDTINRLVLTPTSFRPIIRAAFIGEKATALKTYFNPAEQEKFEQDQPLEGWRRFLGLAFDQPASLLDYLPENTLIALDEPEQCQAHGDRWFEHVEEHWKDESGGRKEEGESSLLPKVHRSFEASLSEVE